MIWLEARGLPKSSVRPQKDLGVAKKFGASDSRRRTGQASHRLRRELSCLGASAACWSAVAVADSLTYHFQYHLQI